MKIGFIVISILSMAVTCWIALNRQVPHTKLSWRAKRQIAVRSLLAGIAVYFFLVLAAALYMAVFAP